MTPKLSWNQTGKAVEGECGVSTDDIISLLHDQKSVDDIYKSGKQESGWKM